MVTRASTDVDTSAAPLSIRAQDVVPKHVCAAVAPAQRPKPIGQPPPSLAVRRSPRLWSILYDGLSDSDQCWVLETIGRYADRQGSGAR